MLFRPRPRFRGLPVEGFGLFGIRGRRERRRAIIDTLHPELERLGQDLVERLEPLVAEPLHAHLPRLDWPRGYEPFCTWLALSRETHGYQAGPQLNLGIHSDFVAIRLGWDTTADAFGRFEFLCRHGGLGNELVEVAREHGLAFRVFASAPWPTGSRVVFSTDEGVRDSFDEVRRHGLWWEIGRHHAFAEESDLVCSAALGDEVHDLFRELLPAYERAAAGHEG